MKWLSQDTRPCICYSTALLNLPWDAACHSQRPPSYRAQNLRKTFIMKLMLIKFLFVKITLTKMFFYLFNVLIYFAERRHHWRVCEWPWKIISANLFLYINGRKWTFPSVELITADKHRAVKLWGCGFLWTWLRSAVLKVWSGSLWESLWSFQRVHMVKTAFIIILRQYFPFSFALSYKYTMYIL